jgi:hypothetical protein
MTLKVYAKALPWYKRPLFYVIIAPKALWLIARYSPYNPWAVAYLNAVYSKYKETTLYEDRLEAMGKDYVKQAFMNNREALHFCRKLTKKDKAKIIFTPFSFEPEFRTSWWRVLNQVLGGGNES